MPPGQTGRALLRLWQCLSDVGRLAACHSLCAGAMAGSRVAQLTAEHIPSLVSRLSSYGAHSVQTRSLLRLLRTGLNPAPFQLFAAGAEAADLVTLTVLKPVPEYSVLDVCGRENSAGRRQLAGLLRSPELAHLWRGPLRVEFIAEGLAPVFSSAAESNGLKRVLDNNETLRLMLRPEWAPIPPAGDVPAGLELRSLEARHMAKVERLWWYSRDLYRDADAMLRDGQAAGMAVGMFLTQHSEIEPGLPLDEPISWSLLNSYGAQSFGYTEPAYRGRGLQSLVLQELLRRTVNRGLPCFGYTTDTNDAQMKNMVPNEFEPEHITKRMGFVTE